MLKMTFFGYSVRVLLVLRVLLMKCNLRNLNFVLPLVINLWNCELKVPKNLIHKFSAGEWIIFVFYFRFFFMLLSAFIFSFCSYFTLLYLFILLMRSVFQTVPHIILPPGSSEISHTTFNLHFCLSRPLPFSGPVSLHPYSPVLW